jgi:D-alanyl-D-alanine carboxypeptidase (penicillin-binding protein 5/6)
VGALREKPLIKAKNRCPAKVLFFFVFLTAVFPGPLSLGGQTLPDPSSDAPDLGSLSAVLMDAATGTFLYYKNPDEEIPPASLTKLMTMHLVFKEAEAGRLSLEKIIRPPRESWYQNQPYRSSLMYLAEGQQLSIRELLLGMAVPSGNDAAVALALQLAPSVPDFVELMNREAAGLGLVKTRFTEPSGISEYNMTTAREFAAFCRVYIEAHPYALEDFHSVTRFVYPKPENIAEPGKAEPGTHVHRNTNDLLEKLEGVDGLKTGYIDEAGYNLALSAQREGVRFIAVILGAPARYGGKQIRDEDGRRLLDWAFSHYKTVRPILPDLEPVRIWKGKTNLAELVPAAPLEFTSLKDRAARLYWKTELVSPLIAPVPAGTPAGDIILFDDLGELRRIPLVTAADTVQGGFFKRLWDSVQLFFQKPSSG